MSASPVSAQGPPDLPGYRCLQHLGAGGNSQVYLYEQDMPRRKVAVKVLNEAGLTEAARRQFTAEANAMASLADHPHIVQVFTAAVTPDDRPYLVMQYFPQPNLNVRARREHFSVAEVLRIGIQIGSAVETSHRTGILHRDIKPHNILTGQFGTPALTDFGIAAQKGSAGAEGMSVPWSPPEVLYGTSAGDERSDVYSLGATLWHLFGGRSPFEQPGGDNSTLALMRRIQSEPPPRTQRQDVPDSLERLLRQAMAKDPALRPQTALAFVRGLQAVEQEQRLPLTQVVLAADEPPPPGGPAVTDAEATVVRSAVRMAPRSGVDPRPPGRPPVHLPADLRPPMVPPAPAATTRAATDTTHIRGAAILDPRRQAFDPRREAPAASVPGRHRQLPAEPREAATRARPILAPPIAASAVPLPDARDDAAAPSARSRRAIGIAVGGLLVVAVAASPSRSPGRARPPPRHRRATARKPERPESRSAPASRPGHPAVTAAGPARRGVVPLGLRQPAPGESSAWHGSAAGPSPGRHYHEAVPAGRRARRSERMHSPVEVVRPTAATSSAASWPACGS